MNVVTTTLAGVKHRLRAASMLRAKYNAECALGTAQIACCLEKNHAQAAAAVNDAGLRVADGSPFDDTGEMVYAVFMAIPEGLEEGVEAGEIVKVSRKWLDRCGSWAVREATQAELDEHDRRCDREAVMVSFCEKVRRIGLLNRRAA